MTSQKWSRFERYFRWYLILSLTLVWIVAGVMNLTGTWNAELFDLPNRMYK